MPEISEILTPERLRRFRLHLNCTQAEMAALLGIQTMTWGRWERGEEHSAHPPMLLYALEYLATQAGRVQTLQELPYATATSLATASGNEKLEGRKRIKHARKALPDLR